MKINRKKLLLTTAGVTLLGIGAHIAKPYFMPKPVSIEERAKRSFDITLTELEPIIEEEIKKGRAAGKKILLCVGEKHNDMTIANMQVKIAKLAKESGINAFMAETDEVRASSFDNAPFALRSGTQAFINPLAKTVFDHFIMFDPLGNEVEASPIKLPENTSSLSTEEIIALFQLSEKDQKALFDMREEEMIRIIKETDQDAMLTMGAAHMPILFDKGIREKFHTIILLPFMEAGIDKSSSDRLIQTAENLNVFKVRPDQETENTYILDLIKEAFPNEYKAYEEKLYIAPEEYRKAETAAFKRLLAEYSKEDLDIVLDNLSKEEKKFIVLSFLNAANTRYLMENDLLDLHLLSSFPEKALEEVTFSFRSGSIFLPQDLQKYGLANPEANIDALIKNGVIDQSRIDALEKTDRKRWEDARVQQAGKNALNTAFDLNLVAYPNVNEMELYLQRSDEMIKKLNEQYKEMEPLDFGIDPGIRPNGHDR